VDIEEYNLYGKELIALLNLRFSPIAFKLIKDESEIPEGYIRPSKERGGRFAACQGFALVRRDRLSLAMLAQDHACIWPMIGYGMAPFSDEDYVREGPGMFGAGGNIEYNLFIKDPEKARLFFENTFPKLPNRSSIGIIIAPLESAKFRPDVVLTYVRPTQLRSILMAVKYMSGTIPHSEFDSVESCLYSTVSAIRDGDYKITVPDPGEYKRAYCEEDEMIFTAPASKLGELVGGLRELAAMGLGYLGLNKEVEPMATGGFYETLLNKWNML
jgi:uncharacterized protein (DUF169 family)